MMRAMRLPISTVLAIACAAPASAQTNRGAISGTVFDQTGGVLPGATVTVVDVGTNGERFTTTSATGVYAVANLEPVVYRVVVELSGFKTAVVDRVKVDTAATATVNVTLETGALESQVTVTAETPVLRAESGVAGQTITERQLVDVPLNNRSVLDLAVTIPNISGDAGSEDPTVTSGATVPGFNLSVNGGRPGSTAILADGVNNTGVGLARAIVSFSPETVQEFTALTSAYSAEFGQTGGGVINATTKSGTNRLTGTGLWYHRNPATNARPFSLAATNRPPNNLRTNQVSFAVGGPVVLPKYDGHNRTFFFSAVEPRWREDHVQATTLLPTDAMRSGDFSNTARVASTGWAPADVVARFGLPVVGDSTIYQQFNPVGNQLQRIPLAAGQSYAAFPGNRIPQTMIDPTALKALAYMPHAGDYFLNSDGQLVNYALSRFVEQNEMRYTVRVDHNLSPANRLTGRVTSVPAVGRKGFGSDVNGNGADYSQSTQVMLSDTHGFSARWFNDFRVNYTRGLFSNDYTPEFAIKSGRNLNTELGLPSLTTGGMPLFQFPNELNAFASIGSAGSTNNYNREQRYNLSDILYFNRGAMSWKAGFDLSHESLDVIPFFGAAGGRYDFRFLQTNATATAGGAGGNGFASYLLGVPNAVLIRTTLIPYAYRWSNGAAFLQDDWKVRPNLTVNLGVRYSVQIPRTEDENDLQGAFRPDLAKTFALPQPLTLADGAVITSALVPPFAYSGRGGRSRRLFPIEWSNVEPRLGFAWTANRARTLVVRGGYGVSHLPLTGNNRLPNPDFGATQSLSFNSGQTDPDYVMRLSSNPPFITPLSPERALAIPADGLVYLGSVNVPGFVLPERTKIPSVQNWNVSVSRQVMHATVVEAAYVGSRGTHLFMPLVNVNARPFTYIDALDAANLNPDSNVTDPLGRTDLLGRVISVPLGTLESRYLGFNRLNIFYDTAADSIRHGAYVSVIRRVSNGLSFTANYTYGHSVDDASDASPDKNVLTSSSTQGHVTFGAPRSADRAVSSFDVKHHASTTFVWDLPFGTGRRFLADRGAAVRQLAGGWTISGLYRMQGGFPFLPKIADTNRLSADQTHTVRPDLVPGVPLVNPLWRRDCPLSNLCEPYVNPAAFVRPAKGTLGNAPRALDIRGPMQHYFDLSVQKTMSVGRTRRMQLRVDLINAFNRPNFRINPNDSGTDLFGSLPSEAVITAAEYDTWARVNGKPLSTTAEGAALFAAAQQMIRGNQLASGALPIDFYRVRLPEGFATSQPNAFDITTLDGYKLYRLRQAYGQGFGQLFAVNNPRYIQFGLKFFF